MAVTRDATSGKYRPANAAEWTELLSGTGINNPTSCWLCQDASGNLTDSIASNVLAPFDGTFILYHQTIAGEAAYAVRPGGSGDQECFNFSCANDSVLAFAFMDFPATANAAERSSMTFGGIYAQQVGLVHRISSSPTKPSLMTTGDVLTNGATSVATGVQPVILQANKTNSTGIVQTQYETLSHSFTPPPTHSLGNLKLGGDNINSWFSSGDYYFLVSYWTGADAEMDATKRAALIDRMLNGPPAVTARYSRGRSVNEGGLGSGSKSRGMY